MLSTRMIIDHLMLSTNSSRDALRVSLAARVVSPIEKSVICAAGRHPDLKSADLQEEPACTPVKSEATMLCSFCNYRWIIARCNQVKEHGIAAFEIVCRKNLFGKSLGQSLCEARWPF